MASEESLEKHANRPLVSICIPVYNSEKTIKETLKGIVSQTYRNLEILVVDNASTDKTLEIVKSFSDPRIKIFRNEKNIGCEHNWTRSINLVSGKYAAIFHSDDRYKPEIIEKQVSILEKNPSIVGVYTRADYINARGEVIGHSAVSNELRGKASYTYEEVLLSLMRDGNTLMTPSPLIRSDVYKRLIPFRFESFGTAADLDLWLRLAMEGRIAIIEERLMQYRLLVKTGASYYQYNLLRTVEEDFFKVLDSHIASIPKGTNLPKDAFERYETRRSIDHLKRGMNHLIKGETKQAKEMLSKLASFSVLYRILRHMDRPKYLLFWSCGLCLLLVTYAGLGKHLGRLLYWYIYKWRARKILK